MLGINLLALAKAEVLKYKDHAGKPIVIDAIEDVEKVVGVLEQAVSKLSPADIVGALNVLFPGKFTPVELQSISTALIELPIALAKADIELKAFEAALDK